jgi:hypothetical protein
MKLIIYKLRSNYLYIFLFFWCAFMLNPILFSGLLTDDAYNYQVSGKLVDENINIFQLYLNETYGWLKNSGRIFPFHWFNYFLNHYLNNIFILKFFIYILNLFFFFIIFLFLFKFLNLQKISIYIIIFLPVLYIFRNQYDPMISWNGRNQLINIFFYLSLIYLFKFNLSNQQRDLYISYIFYFISILFYEISYLNFILIFLFSLIVFNNNKFKFYLKLNQFYILSSIILIMLSVWLKSNYSPFKIFRENTSVTTYDGVIFSFDNFLSAFFLQIKVTFSGFKNIFNFDNLEILNFYEYFFFIFSFFFLIKIFYNFFPYENHKYKSFIFSLGLFNLIVPAVIISSSLKYQKMFLEDSNMTYSNIYYQTIGLIFIFCLLLSTVKFKSKFTKLAFSIIFSCFVIFVSTLTYSHNLKFNEKYNLKYKKVPNLIDQSINKGIFNNINDETIILSNMRLPFDWYWFSARKTNKIFNYCEIKNFFVSDKCLKNKYFFPNVNFNSTNYKIDLENHNIFAFYYYFVKNNEGYVNLFKISSLKKNNEKLQILTNEILEFSQKDKKLIKIKLYKDYDINNFFGLSNKNFDDLIKTNKINFN